MASLASLLVIVGCSDDNTQGQPDTNVTLAFQAQVNGMPFTACDEYPVGSSGKNTRISDFRAFVSNPRLVSADGSESAIALDQDGLWQLENMALLDFEDGCDAGTAQMNDRIVGQVPAGDYTGLCFDLGVPFGRNHLDTAAQPSPLNNSGMYWSWQGGYKFLRVDMTGDPGGDDSFANQGFLLHLGSTACASAGPQQAPAEACGHPNLPTMCLSDFDHTRDRIGLDLGQLLSESDTTINTPDTAPGCMSGNDDPECQILLPRLGLDFLFVASPESEPVLFERQEQQFVTVTSDDG